MLPDFSDLAEVIRVIDIPAVTDGQVLQVMMNADKEQALGRLTLPSKAVELEAKKAKEHVYREVTDIHWRWRLQVAESIAGLLDAERYGIKGVYIFGSVNNANAGPESDIDLLIHFLGSEAQRKDLLLWLDGWNASLSEMNYQRTGYRISALLDVHLVNDEEVRNRTGFASRIGAISDAARPLALGKRRKKNNH
jgi:predicted nucleotidyltransferase